MAYDYIIAGGGAGDPSGPTAPPRTPGCRSSSWGPGVGI